MRLFVLILIICICSSCVKNIESDLPYYQIDFSIEKGDFHFTDIAKSSELIFFVTPDDIKITKVLDILNLNNDIYILDDYNNGIFKFSENGVYITSNLMENEDFLIGGSPFMLDTYNNGAKDFVVSHSMGSQSIDLYSENLTLENRMIFPGFLPKGFSVDNDAFVYHFGYRPDGANINHDLIITDLDFNILGSFFPRQREYEELRYFPRGNFSKFGGTLYYMQTLKNDVFRINSSNNSVEHLYTLGFGSYTIKEEEIQNVNIKQILSTRLFDERFRWTNHFILEDIMIVVGVIGPQRYFGIHRQNVREKGKLLKEKGRPYPLYHGVTLRSDGKRSIFTVIANEFISEVILKQNIDLSQYKDDPLYLIYKQMIELVKSGNNNPFLIKYTI